MKINQTNLQWWCTTPQDDVFKSLGHVCTTDLGRFSYIERGSNVLGVAHLDTALDKWWFQGGRHKVHSPALDDRLGAYVLYDLLVTQGITLDLLFTEGEEIGRSTAREFTPDKHYDWIVSFDRAGTDVVMYQYEDDDHEEMLKAFDLRLKYGSFSDISELEHLGCKAFNIGVGYHQQHTPNCHAVLKETSQQVERFMRLYTALKDTHLPHEERPAWSYRGYSGWGDTRDPWGTTPKHRGGRGVLERNGQRYEYEDEWERQYIEEILDEIDDYASLYEADDDELDEMEAEYVAGLRDAIAWYELGPAAKSSTTLGDDVRRLKVVLTMPDYAKIAYEWHGGQWSPLYSFASTGGVVHSEEHRANLVGEINECIAWCESQGDTVYPEQNPAAEKVALLSLLEYVQQVKVGDDVGTS